MVKVRNTLPMNEDGSINIAAWIQTLNLKTPNTQIIFDACNLARLTGEDKPTGYNITCFLQGLEIAELLATLNLDNESIAAGIVYSTVQYAGLTLEDVEEQLGKNIAQLVKGIQQMNIITQLNRQRSAQNNTQLDNMRKMLLAMVRDVRAVVIKLAERLSMMRSVKKLEKYQRHQIARETMDIFAPLANRLGLHNIKWELEDLAYNYLEPEAYMEIAKNLAERRNDREQRVKNIVKMLNGELLKNNISAEVYGRAKHIYSIKRKMQRKNIGFNEIFDAIAVRILVDTIEQCYGALGIAHALWEPIPVEFDDYVTTPKPNGYQSIHTAVTDKDNKKFEIQIRTHKMHNDAEQGVAAHWMYKEGKTQTSAYEGKIAWLRNLLEWQKELTHDEILPDELEKNVFEDRVYVFTPTGDIIDLPQGTTPLDYAYHIHTEIGHRCKGAKINGKIVPLTYQLQMGDRVEILTTKKSNPSRDWLIINRGYLKTASARAKVLQWFKKQDFDTHITEGRNTLERELHRLHDEMPNLGEIASKLNFKNSDAMLANLGNGTLRLAQIIHLIESDRTTKKVKTDDAAPIISESKSTEKQQTVSIQGVDQLLSHVAKCCKPVPGDQIIGYITQGQGISIHQKGCHNIAYAIANNPDRLIEMDWGATKQKSYSVDVELVAFDRSNVIHDVTAVLSNEKIKMTRLNSHTNRKENTIKIVMTLEIESIASLDGLLKKLNQLPDVRTADRVKSK